MRPRVGLADRAPGVHAIGGRRRRNGRGFRVPPRPRHRGTRGAHRREGSGGGGLGRGPPAGGETNRAGGGGKKGGPRDQAEERAGGEKGGPGGAGYGGARGRRAGGGGGGDHAAGFPKTAGGRGSFKRPKGGARRWVFPRGAGEGREETGSFLKGVGRGGPGGRRGRENRVETRQLNPLLKGFK